MGFINKVLSFTFLHANQSDKPVIGSSAAFKSGMDSQAVQLQTALNALNDALNSVTPGSSGAENLGSAPITGLTGATPYAQLSDLITKVLTLTNTTAFTPTGAYHPATKKYVDDTTAGVVLSQIPDGTVTPAKLSFDPATQAELDAATLAQNTKTLNIRRAISMGGMV